MVAAVSEFMFFNLIKVFLANRSLFNQVQNQIAKEIIASCKSFSTMLHNHHKKHKRHRQMRRKSVSGYNAHKRDLSECSMQTVSM